MVSGAKVTEKIDIRVFSEGTTGTLLHYSVIIIIDFFLVSFWLVFGKNSSMISVSILSLTA